MVNKLALELLQPVCVKLPTLVSFFTTLVKKESYKACDVVLLYRSKNNLVFLITVVLLDILLKHELLCWSLSVQGFCLL